MARPYTCRDHVVCGMWPQWYGSCSPYWRPQVFWLARSKQSELQLCGILQAMTGQSTRQSDQRPETEQCGWLTCSNVVGSYLCALGHILTKGPNTNPEVSGFASELTILVLDKYSSYSCFKPAGIGRMP